MGLLSDVRYKALLNSEQKKLNAIRKKIKEEGSPLNIHFLVGLKREIEKRIHKLKTEQARSRAANITVKWGSKEITKETATSEEEKQILAEAMYKGNKYALRDGQEIEESEALVDLEYLEAENENLELLGDGADMGEGKPHVEIDYVKLAKAIPESISKMPKTAPHYQEACVAAISRDPKVIQHISSPTPAMFEAVKNSRSSSKYEVIQNIPGLREYVESGSEREGNTNESSVVREETSVVADGVNKTETENSQLGPAKPKKKFGAAFANMWNKVKEVSSAQLGDFQAAMEIDNLRRKYEKLSSEFSVIESELSELSGQVSDLSFEHAMSGINLDLPENFEEKTKRMSLASRLATKYDEAWGKFKELREAHDKYVGKLSDKLSTEIENASEGRSIQLLAEQSKLLSDYGLDNAHRMHKLIIPRITLNGEHSQVIINIERQVRNLNQQMVAAKQSGDKNLVQRLSLEIDGLLRARQSHINEQKVGDSQLHSLQRGSADSHKLGLSALKSYHGARSQEREFVRMYGEPKPTKEETKKSFGTKLAGAVIGTRKAIEHKVEQAIQLKEAAEAKIAQYFAEREQRKEAEAARKAAENENADEREQVDDAVDNSTDSSTKKEETPERDKADLTVIGNTKDYFKHAFVDYSKLNGTRKDLLKQIAEVRSKIKAERATLPEKELGELQMKYSTLSEEYEKLLPEIGNKIKSISEAMTYLRKNVKKYHELEETSKEAEESFAEISNHADEIQRDNLLYEIDNTENSFEGRLETIAKIGSYSEPRQKHLLEVYKKQADKVGKDIQIIKSKLIQVGMSESEAAEAVAGLESKAKALVEKIAEAANEKENKKVADEQENDGKTVVTPAADEHENDGKTSVVTPAADEHENDGKTSVVKEEPAADAVVKEEPAADAVVKEEPAADTVVKEEPAADAVVKEEPAADTVVKEEPAADAVVKEEPAADTVVKEEPAADTVVKEEPAADTVVKEEPAVDTVVKEEPAADTVVKEEPKKKKGFFARIFGGRDKKKEDKTTTEPVVAVVDEKPAAEADAPVVTKIDPAEIAAATNIQDGKDGVVRDEVPAAAPVEAGRDEVPATNPDEIVRDNATPDAPTVSSKLSVSPAERAAIQAEAEAEIKAEYGDKWRKKSIAQIKLKRLVEQKMGKLLGQKAIARNNGQEEPTVTVKPQEPVISIVTETSTVTGSGKKIPGAQRSAMMRAAKAKAKERMAARNEGKPYTGGKKKNRRLGREIRKAYREEQRAAAAAQVAKPEPVAAPVQPEVPVPPTEKDGLSEYFVKYSQKYGEYYSGNKGTKGNAHTKEEIAFQRKLNAGMKKLVTKRIEDVAREESGGEPDRAVIDKLQNPVDAFDMEALVADERATLKLFQIAANGVYDDGGNRVRLTRKQRVALSGVLIRVAEKKVEAEHKKAQEVEAAKAAEAAKKAAADGLQEEGAEISNE